MKKFVIFIIILSGLSAFASDRVPVRLSKIFDGDTIEIINENNKIEVVRFDGIDCYETYLNPRAYKQAYDDNLEVEEVVKRGTKSKLVLVKLFKNYPDKQLYLLRKEKDKYNRTIGVFYLGDININDYMVKQGNAKKYKLIKY